jgi:hypothetical protein
VLYFDPACLLPCLSQYINIDESSIPSCTKGFFGSLDNLRFKGMWSSVVWLQYPAERRSSRVSMHVVVFEWRDAGSDRAMSSPFACPTNSDWCCFEWSFTAGNAGDTLRVPLLSKRVSGPTCASDCQLRESESGVC